MPRVTTFGGDILGWSVTGDINVGKVSKTTTIFTPPKRVYDSYGDVMISPSAPCAGIATLDPIAGTAPATSTRSRRTDRHCDPAGRWEKRPVRTYRGGGILLRLRFTVTLPS